MLLKYLSLINLHTHTHTHMYIYADVYMYINGAASFESEEVFICGIIFIEEHIIFL